MPPRLQLIVDDVDPEETVSMTWNVSADGSIEHRPSGMKISHEGGVELMWCPGIYMLRGGLWNS